MYPASAAVAQMLRLRSSAAAAAAATRAISTNRRQRNTASVERAESINDRDKFLHYNTEEGYYKTSPYDPITVPNVPLHEYVWRDFKKWENSVAAVSGANEIEKLSKNLKTEKRFKNLALCKSRESALFRCFLFFLFLFLLFLSLFFLEVPHYTIVAFIDCKSNSCAALCRVWQLSTRFIG